MGSQPKVVSPPFPGWVSLQETNKQDGVVSPFGKAGGLRGSLPGKRRHDLPNKSFGP